MGKPRLRSTPLPSQTIEGNGSPAPHTQWSTRRGSTRRGRGCSLYWPADRTTWDEQSRAITFANFDGSVVTVSDRDYVVLGGGGDGEAESGVSGEEWLSRTEWVARPRSSCPLDPRWGVGAVELGASPPLQVDLVAAAGDDLSVGIDDRSGLLVDAMSGQPDDGASVANGAVLVANEGRDRTRLVLTWSGPPCDTELQLIIAPTARRITIERPPCSGDATAFDRVLVLMFSEPVPAREVQVTLREVTAGG